MPRLQIFSRAVVAASVSTLLWVITGEDAAGARADAVTVQAGIEGA